MGGTSVTRQALDHEPVCERHLYFALFAAWVLLVRVCALYTCILLLMRYTYIKTFYAIHPALLDRGIARRVLCVEARSVEVYFLDFGFWCDFGVILV